MSDFLRFSWNGAVFIAVICALRLLLKKHLPRTAFVVLWLAAVFRLLCPVKLPASTSIWRLFVRQTPEAGAVVRRYVTHQAALPAQEAFPNVFDFLGKLWLAVAVLLLIGIAALYLRGLREGRAAVRRDDGAYRCPKLRAPRVCGIVCPRILLPEDMEEALMPYVLRHERVHIRRGDNLWKLLALVAAAVHWFNPAVWVLVVLLGRDLEVSCDEWVLRGLNSEQRHEYALSIIAMAEHAARRSPLTCGFTQNPLEERIYFIMSNRKNSMIALSVATAMILCTTAAFATDVPDTTSEPELVPSVSVMREEGASDGSSVTTVTYADENGEVNTIGYELFTAEEYEAYLEEQNEAMLAEVAAGTLSQETYELTLADMEETLAGIKAGTVQATKPITLEDGSVATYVFSISDAVLDDENMLVAYCIDENGKVRVDISEAEADESAADESTWLWEELDDSTPVLVPEE